MEKFQELREIAKKKLKLADHILTMTYPVVKDSKLLLGVLENLFLSLTNAMGSVLHYERTFKRIPEFKDNYVSKYNLFREYARENNIDNDYLKFIQEVKNLVVQHKKSPVEFSRKDQFVMCNEDYNMKTISVEQLKAYVEKAKSFLTSTQQIISKDEELFQRR